MKLSIVAAHVIEKLNYNLLERWLIHIGKQAQNKRKWKKMKLKDLQWKFQNLI